LATEVAPEDWLSGQVVGATYAVARWAVGVERRFEVRIDYAERVIEAAEVFRRVLRGSDVRRMALAHFIVPEAQRGLAELPLLQLDDAAVTQLVEEVAPVGYLEAQVDEIVTALTG